MWANAVNENTSCEPHECNPFQAPRGDNYPDPQDRPSRKERHFVARIRNNMGLYLLGGLGLSDVLLAAAYEWPRLHASWQLAAELLTASFFVALIVFWFYRLKAFRRLERAALAVVFMVYAVVMGRFRSDGTPINGGMVTFLFFGSFQLLGVAMAVTSLGSCMRWHGRARRCERTE